MAAEDQQQRVERVSWPGAPYLQYVDSKYHARLLVMAGLGLLPFEIETGRWAGQPRHERMCWFGCGEIGQLTHFLRHCRALTSAGVMSLDRYNVAGRTDNPLRFWRETARKLKCRWRESAAMLGFLGCWAMRGNRRRLATISDP